MIHTMTEIKELQILNKIKSKDLISFRNHKPETIFNEGQIDFLDNLSSVIMKDNRISQFPDVATFSFFCRKANLIRIRDKFGYKSKTRLGRGLAFHVAPSNVPLNFAYSLIAGILSGNSNIVRLPSKEYEQLNIIIDALNNLIRDSIYKKFVKKILLVRYSRNNLNATDYFSKI